MTIEERDPIIAKDGTKLHLICSRVENPVAMVAIVHGFGEHIARYHHVMEAMAQHGIQASGIDLRGHGKSRGLKGHAPSYDLLMDDIEELLKTSREQYTELPLILYGHSMGGNLVANFVLRRPINELSGFILSSPWIRLAFDPPEWQQKAAKLFVRLAPKFRLDNNLNAKYLSKDPKVVTDYTTDPLVNSKISTGLYQMICDAGEYALENFASVKLKGLLYHGDSDQITSHDATKMLADQSTNTKWISYRGVYHEGHNDVEKNEIIKNLIAWIKEQV